jgi:ribosomal protein S18 acetylase RimI-like enzyme
MKLESATSLQDRITYRPVIVPGDDRFLQELYFSTREDLAGVFADETQLRTMLLIQYNGQRATYSRMYQNASHEIVLLDEKPVGRFLADRRPDSILGVDLALVPDARGLGIGTIVLRRVMEECSARRVPLVFHVLKTNRAQRLYERLGCRIAGEDPTHFYMEWRPSENE